MRERLLKTFAHWHANHPWRMLLIVFVLTIIFSLLATNLKVTMRWSDLLPSHDQRTIEFNKIIEEFVSATSIVVVVQGEEKQMKKFADQLVPRLITAVDTSKNSEMKKAIEENGKKIEQLKLKNGKAAEIKKLENEILAKKDRCNKKLVQRVDYKTEIDFLKNHGLMLIKESDLKNIKEIFTDPNLSGVLFNLNNSMEKEYIGDSESMSTREKEDQAFTFLDGIQNLLNLLQRQADGEAILKVEIEQAVDKLLIGEPYLLSYDKSTLILNVIPNFTMLDTDLLVKGTDVIQSILDDVKKNYPDLHTGLTGFIPICHDEMVYSQQSLGYTTFIAIVAILILLIISLRMWVAPFLAIFNLIVGIIWAVGITALIVGQLNIMTQMMSVILLGLGIDFSIHFISAFTEWRAAGDSISLSLEKTFLKSGKGIITGALTTSVAFLSLLISESRGMKEMGLVTGFGLLGILFATLLLLPILLIFRERRIDKKRYLGKREKQFIRRDISFKFLGRSSNWLSQNYTFTILSGIILTCLLIWSASRITFDTNYMNIEPEGLTSIALQDTVLNKFDLSMDYAMVLADDVEQSRELTNKFKKLGSVAMAEDISVYLPSADDQKARTPLILEIHQFISSAPIRNNIQHNQIEYILSQLDRLQKNVIEMQALAFLGGQDKVDYKCQQIVGHPDSVKKNNCIARLINSIGNNHQQAAKNLSHLQTMFAPYFKNSVIQMSSAFLIRFEELPHTILDRYTNKTRDQFLVTLFPGGHIWKNADFLKRFVDDLESVTNKATGMPPIFRALIEIIGSDGRKAVLLTIVLVFLLLWLDFGSLKYAIFAMVPLAAGVFWMVGLMHLTGQQITVMNVMGLPLIIGIGIDDGVHIVHRWQYEGRGNVVTIFSSTGKAILLTSLTTMLAFGSMIFSIWRGFGQLGASLFVGVGACFVTTILILPGIIGWIERKK